MAHPPLSHFGHFHTDTEEGGDGEEQPEDTCPWLFAKTIPTEQGAGVEVTPGDSWACKLHMKSDLDMGHQLYEACVSSDKNLLIVEGAKHARSIVLDPKKYDEEVTKLTDKYIK